MQTTLKKNLLVAAVAAALPMAAAEASVIVLDFEGINATYPSGFASVGDFYNGGTSSDGTSGTNYGVSFDANALAICLNTPGSVCSNTSRGGQGDPNSQLGALFFLSGSATTMNFAAGFDTGFSFFYAAPNTAGTVQVYDGLNGTGNLLASLNLGLTPSTCDFTYSAGYCPFAAAGVSFAGTAKSVNWGGVANYVVFDDVTFGSSTPGTQTRVPVPGTLGIVGLGLVGLTRMRRRKQ